MSRSLADHAVIVVERLRLSMILWGRTHNRNSQSLQVTMQLDGRLQWEALESYSSSLCNAATRVPRAAHPPT